MQHAGRHVLILPQDGSLVLPHFHRSRENLIWISSGCSLTSSATSESTVNSIIKELLPQKEDFDFIIFNPPDLFLFFLSLLNSCQHPTAPPQYTL